MNPPKDIERTHRLLPVQNSRNDDELGVQLPISGGRRPLCGLEMWPHDGGPPPQTGQRTR